MKKIFLSLFLLTISIGQSQALLQGFESGGINGGPFGDMPAPIIETGTGSNTSQVLKIDGNTAGQPWQGINLFLTNPVNLTVNKTLTIDVLSSTPITFLVKVTTGGAIAAAPVTHNGNGLWQTLSFTFNTSLDGQAANPSGTYSGFVIHAYWAPGAVGFFGPTIPTPARTFYVDNIVDPSSLPAATVGTFTVPAKNVGDPNFTLTPPTSNNTSPFTYSSDNNAIATIVGGNQIQVGTGGQCTITASQISDGTYGATSRTATFVVSFPAPGASPTPPTRDPGSVISMYTGNPIEPSYPNPVGYNMIRAPWTGGTTSDLNYPNGSNTCIKLDNFGYFGFVTSAEPVRFSVVGMAKLHVDVYLNTPLANMFVFLLSNGDQIYNTGPLVAGWNSLDISLSNYPGANLASIYGFKFEHNQPGLRQIYLDNIYFYNGGTDPTITDFTVPAKVFGDAPFALTAPTSDSAGAFTYSSSNSLVAEVSGSTVTVTGIGTCTITANQAANGNFDAGSISAQLVVSAPPLTTAAPNPPARNPWDVKSLYSNAYTNLPSAVWVGASTLTDEVLEGNDTKKMSNFLVEFINFAATDVSEMTTLHMDIYTTDCPGFNIWLLNNGDRNAQIFPAVNGWRSLDIPLSTYVNNGLNMTALIQLKFEGLFGPGKSAYVDNVYFYRPATLPPATVGTFTVPAKNVGDATFTLSPPTSNNTSPFTYSSNNGAIATIVNGDQIQVGTGGTCTITASQVSDGTYGPTSRTATFVVSFPAPGPSPIPPARLPSKVKSLYSAAYTTDPGFDMVRAFWTAGATLTTVPNGGDTALRADNLGYIGLIDVTERRLDVSAMTTLHLDVYVDAPFANLFFWLLTDGDQRRDITNLTAGWNSITINLSEFGGANLANVYGFKFEQNQPSPLRFYLDNVYFSDDTVYADADGDGFGDLASTAIGAQAGYVSNSTDCNDSAFAINPGRPEVLYNGVDDNCDGNLDEGFQLFSNMTGCGTTLTSMGSLVAATSTVAATGYRFEVTKVGSDPLEVQTIDRPVHWFSLTQLPLYSYAATYSIRVMIQRNGVWLGYYGTACSISSPAVLAPGGATSVTPSQCGITLPTISTLIATSSLAGATGYKFRVTNTRTGFQQELTRSIHWFSLTMLNQYNYGDTYTVEVAVKTTGDFSGYGSPCNVTAPAVPSLTSQCGTIVATKGTNITTSSLALVTSYDFEVKNMTTLATANVSNNLNWFRLSQLSNYSQSTQFRVRVRLLTSGVFSDYGDACFITSPAIARTVEMTDSKVFEVTASPNPFDNNFGMFLNSTSTDNVSIRVYDMIGRMVEQKELKSNEVIMQEVGSNYPSGVYNVVVTQGSDVKTLRVIKR